MREEVATWREAAAAESREYSAWSLLEYYNSSRDLGSDQGAAQVGTHTFHSVLRIHFDRPVTALQTQAATAQRPLMQALVSLFPPNARGCSSPLSQPFSSSGAT